jgi:site-specific DNA-methyltransferase (adenine-specific)
VEEQLGQESHYNEYLDKLCKIFDFLKTPLKREGSLFVVIGDTYFSRSKGTGGKTKKQLTNQGSFFRQERLPPLMPEGALVDIPSRFSIKMVDDYYWIKKHNIIWHKPNAFVTSNKKKFTLDFEYIYHFILDTKGYYFEQQFEPLKQPIAKSRNATNKHSNYGNATYSGFEYDATKFQKGRNKRSVWSISTRGFKGSHYATYPAELIEAPIKACCPENGTVLDCFMGSGTTAIEAERRGKKWIGIDINEEYINIAIKRILEEREKRK